MEFKNKNWLIYFSSITVASFLLADMTTLILGSKLEASASLLPKEKDPVQFSLSRGFDSRQASTIVEGNIFNSRLRGKKEETVAFLPLPEPVPDLQTRFRLIGTSEGSSEGSFAVLEDQTSKEQSLYHLNDPVLNHVRIAQIQRNKIKLAYAGGSTILQIQLDEERSSQPGNVASVLPMNGQNGINPMGSPHPGIRQMTPNRWVLDRQEVSHNLDNLNQLLTQARVIPNFSDGKPDGFRVFAIVPDSFYEKIGLKNGDVLERVNGIEIKDPESFLKVFQHLKDENRITLDLVRNSQKETMGYEIR
ncbi:MAG: hypothetical protein HY036_02270 [Nitrospirae bacterium]|nr:hypothetical protein [Nitrospirota bacterium]MBI3351382.1 hypothetical protein [Nitrospirota bacterium]